MPWPLAFLARPERFELPTTWFEARDSVQLSYGRMFRLWKNSKKFWGCKTNRKTKGQAALPDPLFLGGEPRWDRTNDHLIKSQVLYQLS